MTRERTPLPPILWLIVRDFGPRLGIGSPDVATNRDTAYDLFVCAVEDGDPVAVWEIPMAGGRPDDIIDVTDEFEREQQDVCIARGLDWPVVRRIEDAPAITTMAAE